MARTIQIADLFCGAGGTSTGILQAAQEVVITRCQRCGESMPDERADCWCAACVTNRELEMLYGDDGDDDSGSDCGYEDPTDCTCDQCVGDGVVELQDTPELWGEDCFCEQNRLVTCPSCHGKGSY